MVRELEHPDRAASNVDAVLGAPADPVRQRIVTQLAEGHIETGCRARTSRGVGSARSDCYDPPRVDARGTSRGETR